jgi:hypothetical protein
MAWIGAQPFMFEVKKRANHHAIGQLMTYRQLWMEDNPDAPVPRLAVIARTIDPDMERSSRPTGLTSTSTRRPPATEEMLHAVYHLTTIKPHEDGERGMTAAEFAVYWQGYYRALAAALASMELVLQKRALFLRMKARENRLARRRAAASH